MKLNTKKFMRNILICIIAWILVSLILNYAPGFKRDKYVGITNLIINDEDCTEQLKNNIYISEDGNVYLSKDDIQNLFDKNIYYDEESNIIITTSNIKIASMVIGEKKITVNNVEKPIQTDIFASEQTIYIPISDLSVVYNISVTYIKDTDVVVIEELNKGLIKAEVEEDATLKFKPRLISKSMGEIKQGENVCCYYTTSKGWRLIRTEDGRLGYVKANMLEDEYIVRQDWNDKIETKKLTMDLQDGSQITLYRDNQTSTKITVKTLFNFEADGTIGIIDNNVEEERTIWATISNKGLEKQTNQIIENYQNRTELINKIVEFASKYKIQGLNIDFQNVNNNNAYDRFIIELAPKLREIGITTNVVMNDSFKETNIVGVADYLITNKESSK